MPPPAERWRPMSMDIAGRYGPGSNNYSSLRDIGTNNGQRDGDIGVEVLPSRRRASNIEHHVSNPFPYPNKATDNTKSSGLTSTDTDEEYTPEPIYTERDESKKGFSQVSEEAVVEAPYHVFTRRQKWLLVYIVSLAGLFSPLSSNIYFPALGAIALVRAPRAPLSLLQGFAPSFWGPLSDTRGRRITFVGTFAVYLVANIGLALSKNFTTLMIFRAVQAAGSAATISVVSDLFTASEHCFLLTCPFLVRMLGQSIGPVVGGIITEYFGFHAIFWFLFILGGIALIVILLFLPETLRRVAGNGTIPLTGIYRPVVCRQFRRHWSSDHDTLIERPPKITFSTIFGPFRFLFEKDVFVTLFYGAIVYTVWSMITSSTTALFQPRFGLGNLQVGLIFLPNGAGCVLGSEVTGKLLDRDYKIIESQYRATHRLPADVPIDRKKLADFPVSRARLRSSWYLIILFVLAVGGYGFSIASPLLASRPGMALPLILQFVIAYTATGIFTQNSALMVDLYPGASASATAVNNLIRCAIGAIGVAVVQFIIDAIGAGITFLIFAIISAVLSPLLWIEWVYGERWRKERMERLQREKDEKRHRDGGESFRQEK
ncbi:major facilitator superfamily domain-containing protein [Apodospora peruviana]|uniref:Major facilitator superfamily domain-containing protein n=1 Tax=Apodospora peruviana TaxID=516989 RepID=A0AAE0MDU5_9PEZI|nr:major facilitator superfamily domain-containing protein [Apodospora peruviana]